MQTIKTTKAGNSCLVWPNRMLTKKERVSNDWKAENFPLRCEKVLVPLRRQPTKSMICPLPLGPVEIRHPPPSVANVLKVWGRSSTSKEEKGQFKNRHFVVMIELRSPVQPSIQIGFKNQELGRNAHRV
jgi:hypothetical protein